MTFLIIWFYALFCTATVFLTSASNDWIPIAVWVVVSAVFALFITTYRQKFFFPGMRRSMFDWSIGFVWLVSMTGVWMIAAFNVWSNLVLCIIACIGTIWFAWHSRHDYEWRMGLTNK